MLVYNGNKVSANAFVPGGQPFNLDDTTYVSDPNSPMTGTGKIDFLKAAPIVTVRHRRMGQPLPPATDAMRAFLLKWKLHFKEHLGATLNFAGGACD
jgi:hypothetical protein